MKTSEFIKKVDELKLKTIIKHDEIVLTSVCGHTAGKICMGYRNKFNIRHCCEIKDDLLDLIVEFAKTPIEEREEEKKYRLLLPNDSHVQMIYVYRPINKVFYFNDIGVTDNKEQDEFTEKEIKALPNQPLIKSLIPKEVK